MACLKRVHLSAARHLVQALAYEATLSKGPTGETEKLVFFSEQLKGASKNLFKTHLDTGYPVPDFFKDAALYTDVNKTKPYDPSPTTKTAWNAGVESRREMKNGFLPAVEEVLRTKGHKRADGSYGIPSGNQFLDFTSELNVVAYGIEQGRKKIDLSGKSILL
jgi:hypothetical protein